MSILNRKHGSSRAFTKMHSQELNNFPRYTIDCKVIQFLYKQSANAYNLVCNNVYLSVLLYLMFCMINMCKYSYVERATRRN